MSLGVWGITLEQCGCGFDEGHQVPKGSLIWKRGAIVRCEAHAPAHARITPQEMDAIRHAQEALAAADAVRAQAAASASPPSQRFENVTNSVAAPRIPPSLDRRGSRVTPRTPKPFATVADVHDPKADAFND